MLGFIAFTHGAQAAQPTFYDSLNSEVAKLLRIVTIQADEGVSGIAEPGGERWQGMEKRAVA